MSEKMIQLNEEDVKGQIKERSVQPRIFKR